MGIPVLILGKSGSGKSASLRNFPEAGVINVLGKPFPFRGKVNSIVSREYGYIKRVIQASKANSIVIDDAGYLITDQFKCRTLNSRYVVFCCRLLTHILFSQILRNI